MKILIFVFAGICIIVTAVFLFNKQNSFTINKTSSDNNLSAIIKKQSLVLDIEGISMRISWAITKPENVEFYSNLDAGQASETIKSEKNCKILVNGGFYSKENTHLGLVVSNFQTLSKSIQNPLFNGYFWIDSQNAIISSSAPSSNPRVAIQSGPLLMRAGIPLLLKIINDEPARRMIAGITRNNDLIFLAVYRDKAEFEGPLLGKLPKVLDLFSKQSGINIIDAINLDGGSASAFLTDFENLTELSQIGSYFCLGKSEG